MKTLRAENGTTNLQFKLLSAIGIVIIVGGHCYHGALPTAYDWFPTYSFNLALFVFISGYFYKDKYEDSILKYIWKRFKRLIIPAYLWNIVYGLFIMLMSNFGYTIGGKVNAYNLFVMPFIDGEAFQWNLGSWFVYPLFTVCVVNVLFRKLLDLIKLKNEYLILVVYLAVGIIGVQLSIEAKDNGGVHGLMLFAYRAMLFLPWLQFGKVYKEKLEKHDNLNSIAYFAILLSIQLILNTFFQILEYTPSKCSGFENGCIIPFVTAITGIAFWLRVSKLLAPVVKSWKFVNLIADNTYSIMIHQMLGFMAVKWIFYAMSFIPNLFDDFDASKMRSSIWYYYLPNGQKLYAIVYLAAGIFLPILIALICKWVSAPIKNKINKLLPKKAGSGLHLSE